MDFLTPEAMREVDRRTIENGTPGTDLMAAAGSSVAEEIRRRFPGAGRRIVILCGSGNNGGDGFVAARELSGRYRSVQTLLAGSEDRIRGDARWAASRWREAGGEIVPLEDPAPLRRALARTGPADGVVLVDALLGTGTRGEVRGLHRALLEVAAGFEGPIVAIDTPSGLDMETGALLGPVPRASLTVTFGAAKIGHVVGHGPDLTGVLVVRDIGLDRAALAAAARREDSARALEPEEVEGLLPLPSRRAHKRTAGVAAMLVGSRAYTGAALLACRGALRAGAGLVYALVPEDVKLPLAATLPEVIAWVLPTRADGALGAAARDELMARLGEIRPDVLAVGPGLGSSKKTRTIVREVAAAIEQPTLLLDADGLNAFAERAPELRGVGDRLRLAITPHPGELGRVLGEEARDVDERRVAFARRAAAELNCAVLLKGAPTVICAPGGGTVLNLTGNPGLARGGTGDLLTGIAAAFLAKRMQPLAALSLAAFVHGLAADRARHDLGTLAMTATDVDGRLGEVLRAVERRRTREALAVSPAAAYLTAPSDTAEVGESDATAGRAVHA